MATLEVADIFRDHGQVYRRSRRGRLPGSHLAAMRAIQRCRTAALGGHLYCCERCGHEVPMYNSCRNRHCPKCQSLDKERWLERQREDLLPVGYFHLVFTLPSELRSLALANQRTLYGLLFRSATSSLLELAADEKHLGARIGILALLHTWSQRLGFHPHVHCIVPGGGLSHCTERWISSRKNFLVPIRPLARLFRGKMLARLKTEYRAGRLRLEGACRELESHAAFRSLLDDLYGKDWVVYCKPPFAHPRRALAYLARYTHRVAIDNRRLRDYDGETVHFSFRDSASGRSGTMRLPAQEFLRRFLLHVLPSRFVRIRTYGLLANRCRAEALSRCRAALGARPPRASSTRPVETWREMTTSALSSSRAT